MAEIRHEVIERLRFLKEQYREWEKAKDIKYDKSWPIRLVPPKFRAMYYPELQEKQQHQQQQQQQQWIPRNRRQLVEEYKVEQQSKQKEDESLNENTETLKELTTEYTAEEAVTYYESLKGEESFGKDYSEKKWQFVDNPSTFWADWGPKAQLFYMDKMAMYLLSCCESQINTERVFKDFKLLFPSIRNQAGEQLIEDQNRIYYTITKQDGIESTKRRFNEIYGMSYDLKSHLEKGIFLDANSSYRLHKKFLDDLQSHIDKETENRKKVAKYLKKVTSVKQFKSRGLKRKPSKKSAKKNKNKNSSRMSGKKRLRNSNNNNNNNNNDNNNDDDDDAEDNDDDAEDDDDDEDEDDDYDINPDNLPLRKRRKTK